jgi:hypothetical protein
MIRDALLALGVLLSTASQLRLGGLPLGPGELCLVLWIATALGRKPTRPRPPKKVFSLLILFWLLFAFAQSIGMLVGLLFEPIRDTASIRHDILAYGLMATVSCMAAAELEVRPQLRRITWLMTGLGTVFFIFLLVDASGLFNIPNIDPWYWNRLRGWSENPNQFALLAMMLTALSIYLAETGIKPFEILTAFGCVGLALYTGLLTRSDSYILFLIVAGPIFLGLKLWSWIQLFEQGPPLRAKLACIIVLSLPLLLLALAPFAPAVVAHAQNFSTETFEDNDQGETRLNLWKEAVGIGVEAKMLGFGPGPHLTSKSYKRPPPDRFEAHNTLLDLFAQGGMLAVFAFLWLIGLSFFISCRGKIHALAGLVCGLTVFGMFHLIVRHPIFWFGITLCLIEGIRALPIRAEGR